MGADGGVRVIMAQREVCPLLCPGTSTIFLQIFKRFTYVDGELFCQFQMAGVTEVRVLAIVMHPEAQEITYIWFTASCV
jgi:hypothetical protein